MHVRSNFTLDGLNIGKADRSLIYYYGLSDFWSSIFEDSEKIELLLEAQSQKLSEIYSKFLQLSSTISIEDIEVATTQQIKLVLIKESDAVVGKFNTFKLPEIITETRLIANRPLLPTAYLESGIHYRISEDGTEIQFFEALSSIGFASRLTPIDENTTTREFSLWFVDTLVDEELLYKHFGKLINISPQTSTENYKNFIYGLYYLFTSGPNLALLRKGLNLALGIPLARETETVIEIRQYPDTDQYVVITDLNSYLIPYGLTPSVDVGDVLNATDELAQWIEVKDYTNDGDWWINLQIPPALMPYVPASEPDRYAKPGTYADYIMRNFLKKHTFLINVKTIDFKNLQNFEQLSSIIDEVKPAYTYPIYIWTVPTLTEELVLTDDVVFMRAQKHQCEPLTIPIDKFRRFIPHYTGYNEGDASLNRNYGSISKALDFTGQKLARASLVPMSPDSGTHYWETTVRKLPEDIATPRFRIGVSELGHAVISALGSVSTGWGYEGAGAFDSSITGETWRMNGNATVKRDRNHYLQLPGISGSSSTTDSVLNSITGDMDIRAEFTPEHSNDPTLSFNFLKGSIADTKSGIVPSFTRNSIATVVDWENVVRPVLNNEARFEGLRRVQNLISKSHDVGDSSAWTENLGATTTSNTHTAPDGTLTAATVAFTATDGNRVQNNTTYSAIAGRTSIFSVWLKGEGSNIGKTLAISVGETVGFSTDSTIILTGDWVRYFVRHTYTVTQGNVRCDIIFRAGHTATEVIAWGGQVEDVTGQSVVIPSELVSTNVLSYPYHGAGIDGIKYLDKPNPNVAASNVVTDKLERWLETPGTVNNHISTPDSSVLSISGDLTLLGKFEPTSWNMTRMGLINKRGIGGYSLLLWDNFIYVQWIELSTGLNRQLSVGPVGSFIGAKWIKGTLDVDNGAGGVTVEVFYSDDGESWTSLGTSTSAGITVVKDGTDLLRCPGIGGSEFTGKVYYAEVRSGIDGPTVAKLDFLNDAYENASSFTSSTGETWTVNKTAGLSQAIIVENKPNIVGVEKWLQLPGTSGNYAFAPDSPALDLTGDLDIRARVTLPNWATPNIPGIIGKFANATSGYLLLLWSDGTIRIRWSDGSLREISSSSPTGLANGTTKWIRATLDVDNGASGRTATFYLSDDGGNWTQLGNTVTQVGVTNIATNNLPLVVGVRDSAYTEGKIHYAEVRDGINGTVVARFNPAETYAGATNWTSSTGEQWTISTSSSTPESIAHIREAFVPYNKAVGVYLRPSAGNYVSTPDTVANSITGDIDIRVKVAMADWSPSTPMTFINKWGINAYTFYLTTTGALRFEWIQNNTAAQGTESSISTGFADGTFSWVRVVLDVDNGAGGNSTIFYTSNDGSTWTQLGITISQAGVTNIRDSVDPINLGFGQLNGIIYYAEIRNGIDGTVVCKFDPLNSTLSSIDGLPAQQGSTVIISPTGETWTVNTSGIDKARLFGYSDNLKGILIEQLRENDCLQSETIGTSPWISPATINTSVTSNTYIAPNGTLSADTITNISTVDPRVQQNFGIPNDSLVRVGSVFVKKTIGDPNFGRIRLNYSGGTAIDAFVVFNSNTGEITALSSDVLQANVRDYGQYWRFWVSGANNSSGNTVLSLSIYVGYNTTGTTTGANVNGASKVLWGAQVEQALFPSSYIPTVASTIIRSTDSLAGTAGQWFVSDKLTIVTEASSPHSDSTVWPAMYSIDDTTSNNRISAFVDDTGEIFSHFRQGGVAGGYTSLVYTHPHTVFKMTSAHEVSNHAVSVNGSTANPSSTAVMPINLSRLIIGGGDFPWNSHIRSFGFYPVRKINSEVEKLSTNHPKPIIAKYIKANAQRSWYLAYNSDNSLTLCYSPNGSAQAQKQITSEPFPVSDQRYKIRIRFDANNGNGQSDARFYYTYNDGVTWYQVGQNTLHPGSTIIFDSTAPIEIGSYNNGIASFEGKIYSVQVYNDTSAFNKAIDFDPNDGTPSELTFTSEDTDSVWTMNGTASIGVKKSPYYLDLNGISGNYVTTDDTGSLTLSDEIDIQVKLSAVDWTTTNFQQIVAKDDGINFREWGFRLLNDGLLQFYGSTTGSTVDINAVSTIPLSFKNGEDAWLRVTRVGTDVTFYTSLDGVNWIQLEAPITVGAGSFVNSNVPIEIGSFADGNIPFNGKIYHIEIRKGIHGVTIARFHADDAVYGSNAFKVNNETLVSYGERLREGDVLGTTFDSATGSLKFYVNGVDQGVAYTGIASTVYPSISVQDEGVVLESNFGDKDFTQIIPAGARVGVYNEPTNLKRDCPDFTRSTISYFTSGQLGGLSQINGDPRNFEGGIINSYVNSVSQFRDNSPYEKGWLKATVNRDSDSFRNTRGTMMFIRDLEIEDDTGTPVRQWTVPNLSQKVVLLYSTTQKDLELKFATAGATVPEAWSFTMFEPSSTPGLINSSAINEDDINGGTSSTNFFLAMQSLYGTFFFRNPDYDYLGIFMPQIGYETYAPLITDLRSDDYLLFIRIYEDTVGVYWVTSNQTVNVPSFRVALATDTLFHESDNAPMHRGLSQYSPYYYIRGGAGNDGTITYNQGLGINESFINESQVNPPTGLTVIYSDEKNPTPLTITRDGSTLKFRRDFK